MHKHLYQGEIVSPMETGSDIIGDILNIKCYRYYSDIIDINGKQAIL